MQHDENNMTYAEWLLGRAETIGKDPLWKMAAYRHALYAADRGWDDVLVLERRRVTEALATQLYRALGSIGANLAEGYSRSSGRDRVRFYEYALGSAREARHWYHAAEPVVGRETVAIRCGVLSLIARMLLVAIPRERARLIRSVSAG